MPNWLPLADVHAQLPSAGAPTQAASTGSAPPRLLERCVECGRNIPWQDRLELENVYVCAACKPVYLQKLREGIGTRPFPGGATPESPRAYRQRQNLIVGLQTELPARCVQCNAPAEGLPLKRVLYWHHPAFYLFLLPGLLIYLIVALIVRKRAILHIGLCRPHRVGRIRNILLAWGLVLLGIASLIIAANLEDGGWALAGIGLCLAGIVWGIVRAPIIRVKRIDAHHAVVTGVCAEYLAELPEWKG